MLIRTTDPFREFDRLANQLLASAGTAPTRSEAVPASRHPAVRGHSQAEATLDCGATARIVGVIANSRSAR